MSIKLKGSSDGSVSFDAPADTSPSGSDITLVLPTTVGSAEQFLKNSGTAGTLEFSSMVETSTGVGIGTSSPGDKLAVSDGSNITELSGFSVYFKSDSTGYIQAGPQGGSSGRLVFQTNTAERMRIDSSGNLNLVSSASTLTDLNFTASDLSVYARVEGGKSGSGVGDLRFHTYSGGLSEAMRIDSSGRVGIGTTSPNGLLTVQANSGRLLTFRNSTTGTGSSDGSYIALNGSDLQISNAESANTIFYTGDTERMRIDNSGRLLINHTADTAPDGYQSKLQLCDTSYQGSSLLLRRDGGASGPALVFAKSRGTSKGAHTVIQDGDNIGTIRWYAADGTDTNSEAAQIRVQIDDTPGSNDTPGRIVFSTCSNGSNNVDERMRITNVGFLKASDSASYINAGAATHEFNSGYNAEVHQIRATNSSFSSTVNSLFAVRSATSSYWFIRGVSSSGGAGADNEFYIRGDGRAFADESWNGGGADYAEYFEWSDGNTEAEDRRGISVVLDGDKIREAVAGEEPIGVISGHPSVVGDADMDRWKGKYLRDDYGSYVLNEDGYRQLNPDFDSSVEYVQREDRPEWDTVGLMGKLRIRKGQVTGTRWIKMRDVSDTVEEWLVR
jgi:hypothetical protein